MSLNTSLELRLKHFSHEVCSSKLYSIGYPVNHAIDLKDFYTWYLDSGLTTVNLNNAGDPRQSSFAPLNTHVFENELIDFLAARYGFKADNYWGLVTLSGTQSNNLGIYYGHYFLQKQTGLTPIVYVSAEAHYSIRQLTDLQQLETRTIATLTDGQIDAIDFKQQLDSSRPALVVLTIGTTFKGAMDNQQAIEQILLNSRLPAFYRHLDAALFGGFLAFSPHQELLDQAKQGFDSIAVSGHKFFGIDEPAGIFLTTRDVYNAQSPAQANYLNDKIGLLDCSRSALASLKLWWLLQTHGCEGYQQQTQQILANAQYLQEKLESEPYPAWRGPHSNTVYFKRPPLALMDKWRLAPDSDSRLGGALAHVVVMQHVTREMIDLFVKDLLTTP